MTVGGYDVAAWARTWELGPFRHLLLHNVTGPFVNRVAWRKRLHQLQYGGLVKRRFARDSQREVALERDR